MEGPWRYMVDGGGLTQSADLARSPDQSAALVLQRYKDTLLCSELWDLIWDGERPTGRAGNYELLYSGGVVTRW